MERPTKWELSSQGILLSLKNIKPGWENGLVDGVLAMQAWGPKLGFPAPV